MKFFHLIFLLAFSLEGFAQDANTQFKENYSKGIELYNKGVDIINNLQPSETVMRLDQIEGDALKQFKEALPYLEKAYSFNSHDKNTLTALMGIYFSMFEMEKYNKYKKEFDTLK